MNVGRYYKLSTIGYCNTRQTSQYAKEYLAIQQQSIVDNNDIHIVSIK